MTSHTARLMASANRHPVAPPTITFFAIADALTLEITGIEPAPSAAAGVVSVPISFDLARRVLSGAEDSRNWVVTTDEEGVMTVVQPSTIPEFYHRVKTLGVTEVALGRLPSADIRILVMSASLVEIHYDGSRIGSWGEPAKLYFTREGDPSYLKCALTLDVNTVEAIKKDNGLDEWPNPIKLAMPDADDLSVYRARSSLKISLET